jgi:rhamnosyltransferase
MKWISEQVDSLLEQSNVDLSIYVSVDLSSDGTYEWFKELESCETRVKVLPYGERYGSAASNFFRLIRDCDFSSYQFVAFADQDDIWKKDKLINSVLALKTHNADAYSSNVTAFWESGKRRKIDKAQPQRQYDFLFESAGPGCTFVFSSELARSLKRHILFCSDNMEAIWAHDWFCYSFSRYNGYKWYIDSSSTMLYRQHELNQVGANFGIASIIRRAKFILSGAGFDVVIKQATLLKQDDLEPIKYLSSGRFASIFGLIRLVSKCRRNKKDQLYMLLAVILFYVRQVRM